MEPGRHVQVDQGKSDFAGDFRAEAEVVTKPLQMNAKGVWQNRHARVFQPIPQLFT